eukprot:m.34810 g.34810  ORF g.34810 m.34810 type:complete len:354 (-) comp17041_c0_seq1:23-1084(-)
MGICMSQDMKDAAEKSKALDKQLAAEKAMQDQTIKLLLLGAGESGKSTLVKQMKIIHGDGYSVQELTSYKTTVIDNLAHSMRIVLEAMGTLKLNLGDQQNRVHVKKVLQHCQTGASTLPKEVAIAIKALWQDTGVQESYGRASEYQLNDSAAYYFGQIDRISSEDYLPSQQDVLRARVKTTGIIETSFKFKSMIFRMFDVGGQRSERKKWIQCFDDVTAVIFVTALSGYDLKLYEDQETNRIHESTELFDAICNNKFFTNTSMILFMNKLDLFAKKIKDSPLKKYFPAYNGPDGDATAAGEFILELFLKRKTDKEKKIYHHFTTATDTQNITVVFDAVSDTIIEKNLKSIGMY